MNDSRADPPSAPEAGRQVANHRRVAARLAAGTHHPPKGCPKCARGEGHQVFVLTVTYPGGRTRQFSVRRERVAEVRRWLSNYQDLKEAIETVCELNHDLLRPDQAASKRRRKRHD
ncbi:DUF6788 family protein [Bradyrhizobium sp. CB82]|uniref:DUF6788 family protein n=1 Tax=Bradyrhizobium sp. CB82 TaxID=3039159 RepID=UPI0032C22A30